MFINLDYINKLFEAIETLGEDIYEEFFEQVAGICCYSLNVMLWSSEDSLMFSDDRNRFSKAVPFLLDVLSHMIIHFDEELDIEWIDDGTIRDYFHLSH